MEPKTKAEEGPGRGIRADTLGYAFASSVMLLAGAGYLLDRVLGWVPVLTILGTLVGAGLAIVWVYTKIRQDAAAQQHSPKGGDAER